MGELLMEIDNAFDQLLELIKQTDIYKKYNHILRQAKDNQDINNIVKDIKTIQQRLVKAEYIDKKNIETLEIELESKKQALYSIPLYQDYLEVSEELNTLIMLINKKIQSCINSLDI